MMADDLLALAQGVCDSAADLLLVLVDQRAEIGRLLAGISIEGLGDGPLNSLTPLLDQGVEGRVAGVPYHGVIPGRCFERRQLGQSRLRDRRRYGLLKRREHRRSLRRI